MKLLKIFFILVVGAVAHSKTQTIDEEKDVKNVLKIEDVPFLALIHAKEVNFQFHEWAIILTKDWLLSSLGFSQHKNCDISLQLYADVLISNGYSHEIDFIIERETDESVLPLYPPFELIKLKTPIKLDDIRKPIPLAEPNYELKENQVVTEYYLNSIFPDDLSSPLEYFNSSSVKVIADEEMYRSRLSSCLNPSELRQLYCDPVVLNGKLVGFSLRAKCEEKPFVKISIIYDWILKHVPELKEEEQSTKRNPVQETTTAASSKEKFSFVASSERDDIMKTFFKELFRYQVNIAGQFYFNNVTVSISDISK